MKKHLVLVGGGHAHLKVILSIDDYVQRGHKVTLISPFPYHYYSGMGPGMLSGIYRPQELRFNIKKMSQDRGATCVQDPAVSINPHDHTVTLQSGDRIPYDLISFNIGSTIAGNDIGSSVQNVFPVKPIENLLHAKKYILGLRPHKHISVVIIGGGPAGVEIAANAWKLTRDTGLSAHISIISASSLLDTYPRKMQIIARKSLAERGVDIIEHVHMKSLDKDRVILEDGKTKDYHIVFLATGVRPPILFKNSGLPVGGDGGLLVNAYLQNETYPEIFGGGDCIYFQDRPLPKVGVYAVRENDILYHNLFASLEGGMLKSFIPQRYYMLILNMGDGTGILWKDGLVWHSRTAFHLKNYIDRKMMRTYQVSGELSE